MVWPKVTISWLNYNSMKIIDIVIESLKAINEIDYPNLEIIIVDNNSTDGSYNIIRNYAEKITFPRKIIRLKRNLGFTGGNNVAFRARSKDSKYFIILNNDAIPLPDSVRNMVEIAMQHQKIGAVQGVIVDYKTKRIDTAGDILDDFLQSYQLCHGKQPPCITKIIPISYADGAYALYSIDAVKKSVGAHDKIFYDEAFAYLDDSLLGVQLWNKGYYNVSIPYVTALHNRSATFGKVTYTKLYYTVRGYIAFINLVENRFSNIIEYSHLYKSIILSLNLSMYWKGGRINKYIRTFLNAITDGKKLAKIILTKYIKKKLKINNMPIISNPIHLKMSKTILGIGSVFLRRKLTQYISEIALKKLSSNNELV